MPLQAVPENRAARQRPAYPFKPFTGETRFSGFPRRKGFPDGINLPAAEPRPGKDFVLRDIDTRPAEVIERFLPREPVKQRDTQRIPRTAQIAALDRQAPLFAQQPYRLKGQITVPRQKIQPLSAVPLRLREYPFRKYAKHRRQNIPAHLSDDIRLRGQCLSRSEKPRAFPQSLPVSFLSCRVHQPAPPYSRRLRRWLM